MERKLCCARKQWPAHFQGRCMESGHEQSMDDALQVALSPSKAARKRPFKLTPLEKKERDRERKKEQSQRRKQLEQERWTQAALLQQAQHSSSQWHQQERLEEELLLRQMERDMIDPQKTHPGTAGYEFPALTCVNPIFLGYAHAFRPASQEPKRVLRAGVTGGAAPAPVELGHPACIGFAMAKHNDATQISPLFFFRPFQKIPLDRVEQPHDESDSSDSSDDEAAELAQLQQPSLMGRRQPVPISMAKLDAMQKQQLENLLHARFASPPVKCLVCDGTAALGCPGCFEFSVAKHRHQIASLVTQRMKTPKTHQQELGERATRHRELIQQLVTPHFYVSTHSRKPSKPLLDAHVLDVETYYANVLADYMAIRKHRTVMKNYVTLHVKALPAGVMVSMRVDIKTNIAYVYELYRANTENPNRQIHLLLPTMKGLFCMNEQLESATELRNGVVDGDFLVEDYHLTASSALRSPLREGLARRNTLGSAKTATPEFLLLSVAILNARSTPQLVAQYLQQNFHFAGDELPTAHLSLQHAIDQLPEHVDRDLYQERLVPHVAHMQSFASIQKRLDVEDQQRERELFLMRAHEEKKAAKIAWKKQQNQLNAAQGHRSQKVLRALAYFHYACESTSNAKRDRVAEERLDKLWTCLQLFEQWKLVKNGRLIDAESTPDTLALMAKHQDATIEAFDRMLGKKLGNTTGSALAYPILCVGSTHHLVVRLGVRYGSTVAEHREYGLVLNLDADFEQIEAEQAQFQVSDDAKKRMMKRGFTKKNLQQLQLGTEHKQAEARTLAKDLEWRVKDPSKATSAPLALYSGMDLLRPPFHQMRWTHICKAYKQVLTCMAFQQAKLDEYNLLAKPVIMQDAILGTKQIAKWQSDVNKFLTELGPDHGGSCLGVAAQRLLLKKGLAILRRRAKARRQQLRAREEELLRLKRLKEEQDAPKVPVSVQLKSQFMRDIAPKIHAMLELTPAEKLKKKAGELLTKAAAKAVSAVKTAKKEYQHQHTRAACVIINTNHFSWSTRTTRFPFPCAIAPSCIPSPSKLHGWLVLVLLGRRVTDWVVGCCCFTAVDVALHEDGKAARDVGQSGHGEHDKARRGRLVEDVCDLGAGHGACCWLRVV
ncbi:TPA: hypothetical protein N0F65_012826 [Lagenidium giganteum]|uniref:Uncharacterized protein n=1 Tax=Lagenidium giganteum TaxID=4803 RepID=A0AAV2YG61_9STRA|nr:TPA: hypothetical protein N0F65_012826 [Lagenidium giganteum]